MDKEFYYIIVYQKKGEMVYIGHLDLMNFWQKVIRMADLSVAYTQGFSKKMKANLIQPLPLGMEGLNEYLHLTLTEDTLPSEIEDKILNKQQNKLVIKKIVKVKYPSKWFSKRLVAAVYQIAISDGSSITSFVSEYSEKILSIVELGKRKYLLKIVNTPQLQLNLLKLFSQLPNIDIIEIKRVRLEYKI